MTEASAVQRSATNAGELGLPIAAIAAIHKGEGGGGGGRQKKKMTGGTKLLDL
jgi:hypothetical protein